MVLTIRLADEERRYVERILEIFDNEARVTEMLRKSDLLEKEANDLRTQITTQKGD